MRLDRNSIPIWSRLSSRLSFDLKYCIEPNCTDRATRQVWLSRRAKTQPQIPVNLPKAYNQGDFSLKFLVESVSQALDGTNSVEIHVSGVCLYAQMQS